jgi:hypothetical protein
MIHFKLDLTLEKHFYKKILIEIHRSSGFQTQISMLIEV